MRVLHIGKYFPPYVGGMENFLGDLCPALEKMGVTVGVLVHEDQALKEDSCNESNITFLKKAPTYGQLLYAPVSPEFPRIFNKTIKEFKPDLIHFHLPNTSAFWALLLPRAKDIPWIIHWHADVVPSRIDTRMAFAYRLYRPFEQLMLKKTQSIIITSPHYQESSNALEGWTEKCHFVPLGINPLRLKNGANNMSYLWSEKKTFKVVSVGRLTYYKGHESLVKAISQLDNVEAIIVGAGKRYRKLRELISSLGVCHKVKLAGFQPNESLNALLMDADCFCLPSNERTEAFGLVLLEAMYYRKPIIACYIPGSGMEWIIDNGRTGILVPPNSPAMLAEGIKKIAENSSMAAEMGNAGFDKYFENFQIDRVAEKIHQIYQNTCSSSS